MRNQVTGYKRSLRLRLRLQVIVSIFVVVFSVTYHLSPTTSLAQESTQSSSLVQKLNDLKSEIASKAAQIKSEINKKVQNKAAIGTIVLMDDGEMTIQTLNATKIVKYDEFTKILGAKNKEIKIDTLEESDKVAALGDVDDKNNLVAQRIVFLENYASNSAQLVWGQVQKVTGASITLKTKSENTQTIVTNAQTQFFLGNEEATINDAKVEKHLTARGTIQKDGSLKAKFIYFIPSSGYMKPEKSDSPAEKLASPSAKPK